MTHVELGKRKREAVAERDAFITDDVLDDLGERCVLGIHRRLYRIAHGAIERGESLGRGCITATDDSGRFLMVKCGAVEPIPAGPAPTSTSDPTVNPSDRSPATTIASIQLGRMVLSIEMTGGPSPGAVCRITFAIRGTTSARAAALGSAARSVGTQTR